jgi:hypothetical protein
MVDSVEAGRITMDLAILLVMSMYSVLRTPFLVSFLSGTLLSTYYCLVASSYLICYVSPCNLGTRSTPGDIPTTPYILYTIKNNNKYIIQHSYVIFSKGLEIKERSIHIFA